MAKKKPRPSAEAQRAMDAVKAHGGRTLADVDELAKAGLIDPGLTEYRAAKTRGFVVFELTAKEPELSHLYYSWCMASVRPYFEVALGKVRARIRLDADTTWEGEDYTFHPDEAAVAKMSELVKARCPEAHAIPDNHWFRVERVPKDDAFRLASELWAILRPFTVRDGPTKVRTIEGPVSITSLDDPRDDTPDKLRESTFRRAYIQGFADAMEYYAAKAPPGNALLKRLGEWWSRTGEFATDDRAHIEPPPR